MKTRLLLFFLLAFLYSNAQVSFDESFESGIPVGWGNINFAVNSTVACSGTKSCSFTTSGLGSGADLSTPTLVSTGNAMTISADYKRPNGFGGAIFYLQYYNFTTSSWVTITTTTSFEFTCQTLSATIPAGTIPAGANVVFNINIYSTGSNWTFYVDNFKVTETLPQLIASYPFNNSLNNAAGNSPFSAANTSFVIDRASQTQSAIRVGSTTSPSTATIANLPLASSERTISFWHKKPTHTVPVGLFAYGTAAAGKTFGLYFAANGNYVFQSSVNDVIFTNSSTGAGIWVHSVLTFKNGVVKLYNNNTFVASANLNLNTGSSNFRLGGNQVIVEFDDLQIYNYELTAAEVSQLHTNNSLSSNDFSQNNLKVSLYPNPVNDILNIETEIKIKSVEIYNLQGQKVQSANNKQINVSDLSSGIYMVRIQDENNAVQTKRILKK